jgi:hypothetical protein
MKLKSLEKRIKDLPITYDTAMEMITLDHLNKDEVLETIELDLSPDTSKIIEHFDKVAKALNISLDTIITYAVLSAIESGDLENKERIPTNGMQKTIRQGAVRSKRSKSKKQN